MKLKTLAILAVILGILAGIGLLVLRGKTPEGSGSELGAPLIARLPVNEIESAYYGDRLHDAGGLVVTTLGADGATMYRDGEAVARASAPAIMPVDTTGAGDTFTAALVVAIAEGQPLQDALAFACAAGASAATRPGAQPSLPFREDVETLLASMVTD